MFGQNTYWTTYQQRCTIIVLLFLTIVGLSACRPKEVELPFENIELYQYSPKYERKELGLMIITSAEEANEVDGWVTVDALKQLQEMDYKTHFAIIAFLGWQPTGHERVLSLPLSVRRWPRLCSILLCQLPFPRLRLSLAHQSKHSRHWLTLLNDEAFQPKTWSLSQTIPPNTQTWVASSRW